MYIRKVSFWWPYFWYNIYRPIICIRLVSMSNIIVICWYLKPADLIKICNAKIGVSRSQVINMSARGEGEDKRSEFLVEILKWRNDPSFKQISKVFLGEQDQGARSKSAAPRGLYPPGMGLMPWWGLNGGLILVGWCVRLQLDLSNFNISDKEYNYDLKFKFIILIFWISGSKKVKSDLLIIFTTMPIELTVDFTKFWKIILWNCAWCILTLVKPFS